MRGEGKLLEAFLGKLASKVLKWALNSVISILEEFSHVSRVLASPSHGANMYELAINFSFPVPAFRPKAPVLDSSWLARVADSAQPSP